MPTLVPVLLFHSVSGSPAPLIGPYAVDERTFGEHLDLVAARGLTTLTASQFLDACDRDDDQLLIRSVVITFDDGFADFASAALPALEERSMTATLFVATGLLRGGLSPPVAPELASFMLEWRQLSELAARGIEIGGHSHSHPHLDTLSLRRTREEIAGSLAALQAALSAPVATFAYPHGYSSARVRRIVRESGYRAAFSVRNALAAPGDRRFALARLMVTATTSTEQLGAWLDRCGAPRDVARDGPRTRGWRAYRRARALATRRGGSDPGWPSLPA